MVKINLTDNAIFDLDEIGNYIALYSSKCAEKIINYLFNPELNLEDSRKMRNTNPFYISSRLLKSGRSNIFIC